MHQPQRRRIQAAVVAGLAVAVLVRSTLPQDSRILGEEEGHSELPGSVLVLRHAATARSAAADGMAAAIRGPSGRRPDVVEGANSRHPS